VLRLTRVVLADKELARLPSAVVLDVVMLESAFDWLCVLTGTFYTLASLHVSTAPFSRQRAFMLTALQIHLRQQLRGPFDSNRRVFKYIPLFSIRKRVSVLFTFHSLAYIHGYVFNFDSLHR
jgi:hypothetical protein